MIIFGSPTENSDWIIGDDGNDWIYGDGGNDLLQGGGGNDLLLGNNGDDTLVPGLGVDFVYGGFLNGDSGNDTVSYSLYGGAVEVSLEQGYGYLRSLGNADKDTLRGIENVRGSAYDDAILGDANANQLYGNNGNDTLSGRGGNDSLYGGNGDDELYGGKGADLLDGGAGVDTVAYDLSSSHVFINLRDGYGTNGDAQGDTYAGIENARGSFGNDYIFGSAVANQLYGQEGRDMLWGFEGKDGLGGGDGDDILDGGADNDVLNGGGGKDTLTGGTGGDRFHFGIFGDTLESALDTSRSDVITDFSHAQGDKIDLSSVGTTGPLDGNNADDLTFTFIGRQGFSGTAGELRYAYENGNTIVAGDIDGDDDADFAIVLTGHHELVAGDFVL